MRHDANFHNLEMDELDILEAYDRYYNDFDERTVFFLLTNEKNRELSSDEISDYARESGQVLASHRVVKLDLGFSVMYYYRLVFMHPSEATSFGHRLTKSPFFKNSAKHVLIQQFQYFEKINGVPVLLHEASKELLGIIRRYNSVGNWVRLEVGIVR